MNLLALDTSTDTLSVGVSRIVDGEVRQWLHTGAGGAQASKTAIAVVLDLLRQADFSLQALDAVCFGAGPGSFTGLRTACAVAQGLAFGANVPVLPVDSLMAVAEEASPFAGDGPQCITALLDARMDEMYMASFERTATGWRALQADRLVRPEQLVQALEVERQARPQGEPLTLAGNVFSVYGERLNALELEGAQRRNALPTAAAMLRLAPGLFAAGLAVPAALALPTYIRDKVAQTTEERMQAKAAIVTSQAVGPATAQ